MNAHAPARLSLEFAAAADTVRTRLILREAQPPLKVVRAFDTGDGAALVHLHNVSGGILGGDRFELTFNLGKDARAQITTTSATRVYRARTGAAVAAQKTEIRIAENGLLELLPDPVIPFAGSNFEQHTVVELDEGAGLFWWETVAPGREARGEVFAYERLKMTLEISACGIPVALENYTLEPGSRALTSLVRLGAFRYFTTFYICRAGLPSARWTALEAELTELALRLSLPGTILWGVSCLSAYGLVLRGLSVDGRGIPAGMLAFWQAAKRSLYGHDVIPPRKVY